MRKRMWIPAAALAVTMLAPAAATAAPNSGGSGYEETRKAAAQMADLLTQSYGTTSVQYALIDGGDIVVSGQSGRNDENGKKPLTAGTMYGIGSTSKMFVTAAVMRLVDEGKVDLDTPVVHYIPEFTMKDERYKQITPRMLLNHSSGLNGSSLTNAFLFEDDDPYAHDTLLEQLAGQTLKADPGAYSVYCNDGFTLAEILVERVSGMDFTSYLHRYFTEPLGLSDTKTPLDHPDVARMAGLYYPSFSHSLPNETVNVIGTGGIYSTAEDLVRFSRIFTGEAEGILSDEAVNAMEQDEYKTALWPDEADTSINYGLGWDSVNLYPFGEYGIQALTKGGDTILYHASLVVLPDEDMAAAVLSSGGSSTTDQLLANQLLLYALKEKGTIAAFKPEKSYGRPMKAEMPASFRQYAGIYGASNQTLKVDIDPNGVLSLTSEQLPGYPPETYRYAADGTFRSEDGLTKIAFVTEDNGRTYLWTRQYASLPGLGQTAMNQYSAEKLEPNRLSAETEAAWKERDGRNYFLLNEKYTSESYLLGPILNIRLSTDWPGYVADKRITGPDTAVSELQIPGLSGRDLVGYTFFKQDGVEYLDAAGSLFVSEDAVKPLYVAKKSALTIPANGYAKWYAVSDRDAGKTIGVKSPANAAFAVYDGNGNCLDFSVVSGDRKIVLPQGGYVVFIGDAGSKFELALS